MDARIMSTSTQIYNLMELVFCMIMILLVLCACWGSLMGYCIFRLLEYWCMIIGMLCPWTGWFAIHGAEGTVLFFSFF